MQSLPLISVIVPVYNVEKYLKKCVLSLVNQTYPNVEILLINDGSKDNSLNICLELEKDYKTIKVFNQVNKGQATARNVGIKNAKGEYIFFVDSDDYISSETLEYLYQLMIKNHADISGCNIEMVGEKDKHIGYYENNLDFIKVFTKDEAMFELCKNQIINSSVCTRIYKAEIIKNCIFKENIKYEDADAIYKWIDASNKIVITGKPFYKYYFSEESTLRGELKIGRFDLLPVSKEKIRFYEEKYPQYLGFAVSRTIDALINLLYDYRKSDEFKDKSKEVEQYVKYLFKSYKLQYTSKGPKLRIKIYRFSKRLYYLLKTIKSS